MDKIRDMFAREINCLDKVIVNSMNSHLVVENLLDYMYILSVPCVK